VLHRVLREKRELKALTAGAKKCGTIEAKSEALQKLVRKRQSMGPSMRLGGYACIEDFHNGAYECKEYVSPWTKSGCNLDAVIMVVGQDWSSADALTGNGRPDPVRARLGYDPCSRTNKNLDRRLREHFALDRADCYLTNMFPFVKPGKKSANNIRWGDMKRCAREFTLEEVRIVAPRLVLCLGLETFSAFSVAAGRKKPRNMEEAIKSSFEFEGSTVYSVAHVGSQGENTRNRGRDRDQVAADWQRIASSLRNAPAPA
jgi:restriction system protein